VIQVVAAAVGPVHTVDLQGYELLILVDVYRVSPGPIELTTKRIDSRLIHQNICGMSVVGSDYENLKRFNLAEIYQASSGSNTARTELEVKRQ
jgi:tRNA acetyltransferase TAN1